MTPSPACIALAKTSESCRLVAYPDTGGIWTIGWGHTGPEVVEGLAWTQAQADLQFEADMETACREMEALVKVPLAQGQMDALTDFTFNMGAERLAESHLLKVLNAGLYTSVPFQLYHEDPDGTPQGWIYGEEKGKMVVLEGLVTRRKAEIALWNS